MPGFVFGCRSESRQPPTPPGTPTVSSLPGEVALKALSPSDRDRSEGHRPLLKSGFLEGESSKSLAGIQLHLSSSLFISGSECLQLRPFSNEVGLM